MTLLGSALVFTLGVLPVPTPAPAAAVGMGPFHLGMSRAEAVRVAPCRLRRPPGRNAVTDLACSNFKLLTAKMELRLSFTDDRLSVIGLSRSGISELRARQGIEIVLTALAAEFGALRSPQLPAQHVTAEAAFVSLKRTLIDATTARLTVVPQKEIDGLNVSAWFSLSRGTVPRSEMSDVWYEGARPPVSGSPFDLVTHTVFVTIRSRT